MNINCRVITKDQVYTVRHPVLRAGKPLKDAYFKGDELSSTLHFGLYATHELVAVLTLLEFKNDALGENVYQLRGMAVLSKYQGKGYGKKTFKFVENELLQKTKVTIWCNVRYRAVPFYKKLGFKIFDAPIYMYKIGVHFKMIKHLH